MDASNSAAAGDCEGEILAGKACPDDVTAGNGRACHLLDGAEMKVVGSVVGGVDRRLLGANVV